MSASWKMSMSVSPGVPSPGTTRCWCST
ncbi:FDLD family class I lanthipeptide [Amycolatopsis sp. NPDC051758]